MPKPSKKTYFLLAMAGLAAIGYITHFLIGKATPETLAFDAEKTVTINDNGFLFRTKVSAATVAEALKEKNVVLAEHDQLLPAAESPLFPGMTILINRAVRINIAADGKNIAGHTTAKTVGGALAENGIRLGRLDKVAPDNFSLPTDNMRVVVTRINIEEKTVTEEIDFRTVTNNDSSMGWQEQKITQPGSKGSQEIKYRITYKNGQVVSKVALEKKVIAQPTSQIVTQGTRMELGKANKGQGTWYAYKGGMFAASTTIPKGAYVKVTSLTSGKSIVVQINDYGPQGKGRIIDLDKVAFQKLAPLGAGVIGIKVEQILN